MTATLILATSNPAAIASGITCVCHVRHIGRIQGAGAAVTVSVLCASSAGQRQTEPHYDRDGWPHDQRAAAGRIVTRALRVIPATDAIRMSLAVRLISPKDRPSLWLPGVTAN